MAISPTWPRTMEYECRDDGSRACPIDHWLGTLDRLGNLEGMPDSLYSRLTQLRWSAVIVLSLQLCSSQPPSRVHFYAVRLDLYSTDRMAVTDSLSTRIHRFRASPTFILITVCVAIFNVGTLQGRDVIKG